MIREIDKKVTKNTLSVKVECEIDNFAKNPIILLTTGDLIDILKEEYNIIETIKEPSYKVGNSNIKKVTNIGEWSFKISIASGQPKTKAQNNKKKTEVKTPVKKANSIRKRISKLANS